MSDRSWTLLLHGGARTIYPEQASASRRGCLAGAWAGQRILHGGGSALDAVEATVRELEDDPIFNAGRGSVLNAAGEVEMDAAIMDGATLDIGGVAAIRDVRHPVSVARSLLREIPVLLAGEGASRFAGQIGAERALPHPSADKGTNEDDPACDTVGCIAVDCAGHIAAATSTGGLTGKLPGRVGDTCLPGCGFYADDQLGATAFSGDGESIARTILAATVMQALEAVGPLVAAQRAMERLERSGGEAGVIVIDRQGRIGIAHNSRHFAVAVAGSWLDQPRSALQAQELEGLMDHD